MRWTLPVLALTLSASTAGAAGAASPVPRTLAVTPGPVSAVAQDDGRVAWYATIRRPGCPAGVYVLGGRRTTRVACTSTSLSNRVRLALTGQRVLWTIAAAGNISEEWLYTASLDRPTPRLVEGVLHETDSRGDHLTGLAGDAPSAAYAVVDTRTLRGALGRLAAPPLPVAAAKLAVDGTLAATAEANAVDRGGRPYADTGAKLSARSLRTGNEVYWVRSDGRVRALALDWPHVVAIVSVAGERRLYVFNAQSGSVFSGTLPDDASSLSADRGTVVFRSQTTISAFERHAARTKVIVRTRTTPVGLSIEGNRVVWAENERGRGRIRALVVS